MEKSGSVERKPTLSFSLPRPLVDYLDRRRDYYKGQSPMATVAFSEFIANDERREMQDRLLEYLKEKPENEEVLKLLKTIPTTKANMIRAYVMKGMASIILDQPEEALEYFKCAKELEESENHSNTHLVI